MARSKYRFNPDTLSFERIARSLKTRVLRVFAYFISSVVIGGGLLLLVSMFIDLPKERMLKRENGFLLSQYDLLSKKMDNAFKVLEEIETRDDNLYRIIFEAEPIPKSLRNAGFGGVNRYADLEGYKNSEIVANVAQRLDIIQNKLVVQSKSYDKIFELAKTEDIKWASIPSIQPIATDELTRIASYFSLSRLHPILKVYRPHKGIDFAAPRGTNVHSTGEGVVEKIKLSRARSGYGTWILIDHGFGYESFYGHLDKILVRVGQKVKRGDVIGLVGSTGLSLAPHVHYEVRKNKKAINPINYFYQDLSPEEYQRIIELSRMGGQSLD
ncbi:MAG: M23 family metallopeptidase [Bacteroidales bacterium]|nr:M23 family metallopeptidase [Bacteroidales bacterium]